MYFDTDISARAQDEFIQKGKELFAELPIEIELTNEARVHLWYKEEVGKDIQPYTSTEDAINTGQQLQARSVFGMKMVSF